MTLLVIGIVVMIGIHLVPAFPDARERLIGQLGQNGYRLLFSVLSTLGLVLLVYGFAKRPSSKSGRRPIGRATWPWC